MEGTKFEVKTKNKTIQADSLGLCPIRSDSTCMWGAIDLDEYKPNVEELFKKIPKERITKFTKMIYQYISKAKKQLKIPQDLKNEIENFRADERVYTFLIIANRLYQLYEKKLQKELEDTKKEIKRIEEELKEAKTEEEQARNRAADLDNDPDYQRAMDRVTNLNGELEQRQKEKEEIEKLKQQVIELRIVVQ